jgi:hypothetical protein
LIILLLLGGVFVWKPVAALAVASTGYLLIGLGFGVFDAIRSMLAGRNPLDEEGDDEASDAGLVTEKPEADSGPAPGR